jgi:hypothetical protein
MGNGAPMYWDFFGLIARRNMYGGRIYSEHLAYRMGWGRMGIQYIGFKLQRFMKIFYLILIPLLLSETSG